MKLRYDFHITNLSFKRKNDAAGILLHHNDLETRVSLEILDIYISSFKKCTAYRFILFFHISASKLNKIFRVETR